MISDEETAPEGDSETITAKENQAYEDVTVRSVQQSSSDMTTHVETPLNVFKS